MSCLLAVFVLFLTASEISCRSIRKRSDDDSSKSYQAVFELILSNLVDSEGTQVSIPDIEESFGGWWLKGRFHTSGGVLSDLSTLDFEGASSTDSSDNTTTLIVQASMETLQVAFSHFKVSTRLFSSEGSITVKILDNLIDFQVKMTYSNGNCSANLDYVKLRYFDDLEIVDLNVGGSADEFFVKEMLDMGRSVYIDKMASKVESELQKLANPYVQVACDM